MYKLRIVNREDINSDIEGRENYSAVDESVSSEELKKLQKIRKRKALNSFLMKVCLVVFGGMM